MTVSCMPPSPWQSCAYSGSIAVRSEITPAPEIDAQVDLAVELRLI